MESQNAHTHIQDDLVQKIFDTVNVVASRISALKKIFFLIFILQNYVSNQLNVCFPYFIVQH